jgi:hypothetical protein
MQPLLHRKAPILHTECLFVALGIKLALITCHIEVVARLAFFNIFPHYLINDTILGRKLMNMKCVF